MLNYQLSNDKGTAILSPKNQHVHLQVIVAGISQDSSLFAAWLNEHPGAALLQLTFPRSACWFASEKSVNKLLISPSSVPFMLICFDGNCTGKIKC